MSEEDLSRRISELEEQLANKEMMNEALGEELKTLTKKLEKDRLNFEDQISKVAESQEDMNRERDQRIQELENELSEYREIIEKKGVKELQAKFNIQKTLSEKKQREASALVAENEKLKAEIEKLNSKIESFKAKGIKELQHDLKKKEVEVDELHLKLVEFESLQTEMLKEQEEIVQAFERQSEHIKELDALNQRQQDEIARLSQGLDAQKLKAMDDFVHQLQTELRQAKTDLDASEQLRSEQAQSINRFESLLAQFESQIEQQVEAVPAAQPVVPQSPQATIPMYPAPPQPTMQVPRHIPEPTPSSVPSTYVPPQVPPSFPPAPLQTPEPIAPAVPISGAKGEVVRLLDTIATKAQSGMAAVQLGTEMEQIRNRIVEIFEWHPTLFELAAFARRLKKSPPTEGIDPETLHLLLEKIASWKERIVS